MTKSTGARLRLFGVSAAALAASIASGAALAETAPTATTAPAETGEPKTANSPTDADAQKIAEGSDIIVTATKANEIAPVTASLQTTQPQSIISRSFIEDSLPATSDFNQIALISPSVSNSGNANGSGLSESKAQIRGFQDGEYNVTYDGVPFGDTNDPTHHSNTFFPSNTVETLIVDRGPGNASNLGQATFGGSINMFSRATREEASVEAKGTYGSYNTWLLRGLVQSGAIKALGGTEVVVSGQHIQSDGLRTFSPFKSNNVFGKAVIPIGTAKLTLLATYNENDFNQPDNDGPTITQVNEFGKYFSLNNDPNTQTYYKYNHTHKTTDFELAKLEVDVTPYAHLDTRGYTYSYDNETLSGSDVTLYGNTAADMAAVTAANKVILTQGGTKVFGVPGYTKPNKYRVIGDITKLHLDLASWVNTTVGFWYEHSNTYRQQRDVNLLTMDPNFAEKTVTDPSTGLVTPSNIKFDQDSHINHLEEFIEVELRPFEGLKITPGFKHAEFTRIDIAAYNQTTRIPANFKKTYTADLPFLTINYQPIDSLSFYAQYAKGFLMPPLSQLYVANPSLSTVDPQKSTNYQVGAVYHGGHLSVDVDGYYIDFKNKFSPTGSGANAGFTNIGGAIYKGIEGQATYAFNGGFAVFANGSVNYAKTNNPGEAHLQVKLAPTFTAAGGIIYKHGPIRFSLIDKYTGKEWFAAGEPSLPIGGADPSTSGYNSAIVSARYEIGPVRLGVEINNLFNSQRLINNSGGQLFYQPPRAYTGDITLTF